MGATLEGEVWVDGDGSGAQVAQLLCKVTPGMTLSAADFGVLDFAGLPNYL
jgi:hypothetical protein